MSSSEYWFNDRKQTIVDRRPGGPGNNWQVISTEGTIDAPSGGGRTFESLWGRSAAGQDELKGTRHTGNPNRFTFNLSARIKEDNFLDGLLGDLQNGLPCGCVSDLNDVRVRKRCGDARVKTNWEKAIVFVEAGSTGQSFSDPLADNDTGDRKEVMQQEAMTAALQYRYQQLTHLDLSKSVIAEGINKVIHRCDDEYWFGADSDGSGNAGRVGYTEDGGQTWTVGAVNVFGNTDNVDSIAIAGDYILAASGTAGVAYAKWQDVKDGIATPWTLADPWGTSTDYVNDLFVTDDLTVWAVGNSGIIHKSTDSGLTFSVHDNGVTTANNLTTVWFANNDLGYAAGASGTLIRYKRGAWSVVTVTGLSDAINAVRVPPGREAEIFLGTAGGDIYRSTDAEKSAPSFSTLSFNDAGSGTIDDIQFTGYRGDQMFVLQTDATPNSRVLRDESGGAMGADVTIIESYATPSNAGFNSIALKHQNEGIVVGEPESSQGFIGKIQA